ncbi:hypothetical protein HDF11_004029 [Tunturiibacter psychrotolerans]
MGYDDYLNVEDCDSSRGFLWCEITRLLQRTASGFGIDWGVDCG